MSEIAFCVLPCPSAYSNDVTLGHLAASSLAEAVVTRRQLLPPKPSVMPSTICFEPHHDGAFGLAGAPPDDAEPLPEPPPHAARASMPTLMAASTLAVAARLMERSLLSALELLSARAGSIRGSCD